MEGKIGRMDRLEQIQTLLQMRSGYPWQIGAGGKLYAVILEVEISMCPTGDLLSYPLPEVAVWMWEVAKEMIIQELQKRESATEEELRVLQAQDYATSVARSMGSIYCPN